MIWKNLPTDTKSFWRLLLAIYDALTLVHKSTVQLMDFGRLSGEFFIFISNNVKFTRIKTKQKMDSLLLRMTEQLKLLSIYQILTESLHFVFCIIHVRQHKLRIYAHLLSSWILHHYKLLVNKMNCYRPNCYCVWNHQQQLAMTFGLYEVLKHTILNCW